MFARFTPIFIALLAMVGAAAAADSCQEMCCATAGDAPSGWQGSDCKPVNADGPCSGTKFCCYYVQGTTAGQCTSPQE